MKELGFKDIKLNKLLMPSDMPKRIKSENAANIGESAFGEMLPVGIMHPPTVRRIEKPAADGQVRVDHHVCSGGDRIAAALHMNIDHLVVRLVECTEAEFEKMQLEENTHRRDDTKKRAERLERVKNIVAAQHARKVETGEEKPGEKRAKVSVRREVAKATGITPEGVRKAEQRARKRVREVEVQSAPIAEPEEAEACIATFGIPLGREFMQQMGDLQNLLERAERYLTSTKGVLTQIQTQELPFPSARLQAMQAAASELSALVASLVPRSLCAYCKGQEGYQEKCTACVGLGYITEAQLAYPPELRNPNHVLVAGELVDLREEERHAREIEEGTLAEEPYEHRMIPEPAGIDPFEGL